MKKVSIIVPVYNREKTIDRCIESILAQDFCDFECILVDDGSKDKSMEICESFSKKDDRIIVLKKKNGGVSSARNMGLEHAIGEWVVFVDSDDVIASNHLTNLLKHSEDGIDMVFCGFETVGDSTALNHLYEDGIYKGKDGISKFLNKTDAISYMPICDRMFRRSVIYSNKLRFDESLPLSEDRLFSCMFLLCAKGVATVEGKTYIIDNVDNSSLTHRQLSSKDSMLRYKKLKKVTEQLICYFDITAGAKKLALDYIELLYAGLINSYRFENRIFSCQVIRIMHKLGLK